MANPYRIHHTALLHVIRYIHGFMSQGVLFGSDSSIHLEGYTHEDWAGCPYSQSYVTGWCMFRNNPIYLNQLYMEANFATSIGISEIVCLQRLLSDPGVVITSPTLLHVNNTSAIKIVTDLVQHENKKHIEVGYHYIQELVIDR